MIERLTGKVVDSYDQMVVIDCSGVGYGVAVSSATQGSLKTDGTTTLYIYEHIREEGHDLYGFTEQAGQQFFVKLLSVNGVGPKMALSLMNLGTVDELRAAIGSGNTASLLRASGVGRRLAERIIVELKDSFAEATLLRKVSKQSGSEDALSALVALGYSQAQALEALSEVVTADSVEDQIKQALKVLAG